MRPDEPVSHEEWMELVEASPLTMAEIARVLGVSTSAVSRWCSRHHLQRRSPPRWAADKLRGYANLSGTKGLAKGDQ